MCGKLCLDLFIQGIIGVRGFCNLALVLAHLVGEVVYLLLLGGLLALKLGLIGLELGFEGLDLVDGLGLLLGVLVQIIDAAHKVLGAGGAKDKVQDGRGALLVGRAHVRGKLGLLLFKLLVCGVDLKLLAVDIGIGLLDLLGGLFEARL